MSTDITVSLPDSVCQAAQVWATQTGQSLPEFLAEAIQTSPVPLGSEPPAVRNWSDAEVTSAADAALSPKDDRKLIELLSLQRESQLNAKMRGELARLMQLYQEGLVRKAAALREAVHRGLREPLSP